LAAKNKLLNFDYSESAVDARTKTDDNDKKIERGDTDEVSHIDALKNQYDSICLLLYPRIYNVKTKSHDTSLTKL